MLDPTAALGPLTGLSLISAVSGVLLLFAFRFTSRPAAIRQARNRVQAHLLAVRIYRDDLGVVFRSQAKLLSGLFRYMGQMLIPFLVLALPFGLLFAHLEARFASRALHPGERTLVRAIVPAGVPGDWTLESDDGIVVETPPVRIPSRGEIDWRIRAVAPGEHRVSLVSGARRIEKRVAVASDVRGAAPARSIAGFDALLFAPTEPPIPAADGVERIDVLYPALPLSLLGWNLHWIVVFLAVSAAVAFALRKRAGVEF